MGPTHDNSLSPKAQMVLSGFLTLFPDLKDRSYDELRSTLTHTDAYAEALEQHENERRRLEQLIASTDPEAVQAPACDENGEYIELSDEGRLVKEVYEERLADLLPPTTLALLDTGGDLSGAIGELQAAGLVEMRFDWDVNEYLYSLTSELQAQAYQVRGLSLPAEDESRPVERALA
jgi:hypothetical protein